MLIIHEGQGVLHEWFLIIYIISLTNNNNNNLHHPSLQKCKFLLSFMTWLWIGTVVIRNLFNRLFLNWRGHDHFILLFDFLLIGLFLTKTVLSMDVLLLGTLNPVKRKQKRLVHYFDNLLIFIGGTDLFSWIHWLDPNISRYSGFDICTSVIPFQFHRYKCSLLECCFLTTKQQILVLGLSIN